MKSEKKLNNKGYTLVELMVTVLITGMVVAIISIFMSVSRISYDEVKKEAVLQQEARMAGSYIGDIAIEASECTNTAFAIGTNNYKVLNIKAPDSEYVSGTRYNYYYIILWEETNQVLRFCKVKDDSILQVDGTYLVPVGSKLKFLTGNKLLDYASMLSSGGLGIIDNPRALLAKYVNSMDVIIPDSSTNSKLRKIIFKLHYRDSEYVLTKTIAGRNMN